MAATILTRWSMHAPLDVLDWLTAHPDTQGLGAVGVELPAQFYARLGSLAAELNDRDALAFLARIHCGHGYLHDHLAAIEAFAARRLRTASAPLEDLSPLPPAYRAPLQAAAGEFDAAITTLERVSLPAPGNQAVVKSIARCWAQSDHSVHAATRPGEVLATLAASLGDRDAFLPTVFPHLHRVRTEHGLGEWLLAQPGSPGRDACLLALAQSQFGLRPDMARLLARNISTPSVRQTGLAQSPELF